MIVIKNSSSLISRYVSSAQSSYRHCVTSVTTLVRVFIAQWGPGFNTLTITIIKSIKPIKIRDKENILILTLYNTCSLNAIFNYFDRYIFTTEKSYTSSLIHFIEEFFTSALHFIFRVCCLFVRNHRTISIRFSMFLFIIVILLWLLFSLLFF